MKDSSQQIRKLILNPNNTPEIELGLLGDEKEIGLYFDFLTRRCFLKNIHPSKLPINIIMISRGSNFSNGICIEFGETEYLDLLSVENFGDSSIMDDCSFTSTENVWGFDYNNECLSSVTYGDDSLYNRVLASIVIIAKPA